MLLRSFRLYAVQSLIAGDDGDGDEDDDDDEEDDDEEEGEEDVDDEGALSVQSCALLLEQCLSHLDDGGYSGDGGTVTLEGPKACWEKPDTNEELLKIRWSDTCPCPCPCFLSSVSRLYFKNEDKSK